MSTDPDLNSDAESGTVLKELLPGFEMRKADPKTAPAGVTYAGIVRTPDGQSYGIHARVVELGGGHKGFVGGLFRIDEGAA